MPHQCVRCDAVYEDGSSQILKGCTCGGRLFFYIKKEKLKETVVPKLSSDEKKQIEEDVFELIGDLPNKEAPVVLDIEAIRILKPGKYELDLVHLFNKEKPLVYKLEEGKYMIDLAATFMRSKE